MACRGGRVAGAGVLGLLMLLGGGVPAALAKEPPVDDPELVRVAGGCFQMGSPLLEEGRDRDEGQHRVCVKDFQLGRYEVTVREFARFVAATGYRTEAERGDGCSVFSQDARGGERREGASWRNPGFAQDQAHPVVCVPGTTPRRTSAGSRKRPASATGCRARPSGSTRHGPGPPQPASGATTPSLRAGMRTWPTARPRSVTTLRPSTTATTATSTPRRSGATSRTRGVSTTSWATCGSGPARRTPRGTAGTRRAAPIAGPAGCGRAGAAVGAVSPGWCEPRPAAGTIRHAGTAHWVSAWQVHRDPRYRVEKGVELNFAARPPPRLKRGAEIQFDPFFRLGPTARRPAAAARSLPSLGSDRIRRGPRVRPAP